MRKKSETCSDAQSAAASKAAYARWASRPKAPDGEAGELWRDVPSLPGYQASSLGNVRSRYKILKQHIQNKFGHRYVAPSVAGKQAPAAVHAMVCEAFHGPRPDGTECRHLDGDASNNKPENLRWGTRLDNQRDRSLHSTCNSGQRNGRAAISNETALAIYEAARASRSNAEVAKAFGVTPSTVSLIRCGLRWSNVTGHQRADKRGAVAR